MFSVFILSQGFFSCHAQPAGGLEGHKELGGDTARTADQNWPTGYSIPCDVMPSIYGGELAWGDHCSGTNWALVGEWSPIALCITCFVYSNPFISIVILLLLLLSLLLSSFLSY